MNKSPYRALLPLAAVIVLGLAWAAWPWHARRLYTKWWTWELALPFFAIGIRTYSRIFSGFGRKLTGEAEVRPGEHEQKLVVTGLHARMRHPIYFAHLCNLAGCAIGSGLLEPVLFFAISCLLTFPLMIWLEERELERRFGQSYLDYKRAVPLVPSLFSSHTYKKASA
jgi:protein-S-isoprenylcysteine O-methyltransferase Ste14